jgi:hypothetical protein
MRKKLKLCHGSDRKKRSPLSLNRESSPRPLTAAATTVGAAREKKKKKKFQLGPLLVPESDEDDDDAAVTQLQKPLDTKDASQQASVHI